MAFISCELAEGTRRYKRSACRFPGRGASYLNAPPTDPDVNDSLIRFLGMNGGDKSPPTSKAATCLATSLRYPAFRADARFGLLVAAFSPAASRRSPT